LVSGSNDKTIKLWDLSGINGVPTALVTVKAHDKDINTIAVSPNDKIIATGSQDRTIKLWNADHLLLLGVLNGHRRGVWCVNFSPVDQCIVSASADTTIRIWSLKDRTCIKTFEGHTGGVLRVTFVTLGMQLLSCGTDGLIKLWTIKNGECVKTDDSHEEMIWALSVSPDQTQFVTGGADSTIQVWRDSTVEEKELVIKEQEEKVLKEQQLSNSLQAKDYHKAFLIAFTLGQTEKILGILRNILEDSTAGEDALLQLVKKLTKDQVRQCLIYIKDWNTIAKFSGTSQRLLHCIFQLYSAKKLLKMVEDIPLLLQSIIPYTDKHFARIDKLLQRSYIIDYTINSITNHVGNVDVDIKEEEDNKEDEESDAEMEES